MAGHGFVTDAAPGPIPPGPIAPGPTPDATRRDFLFVATGAFAAVGGIFAVWPFIDQMEPAADVIAAGAPLTVDVSKIPPGQQIVVIWRAKPIFIVHRTPALRRATAGAFTTAPPR
jgi:ubiquinol-cytochrome c reductase iron-sulfur subunit